MSIEQPDEHVTPLNDSSASGTEASSSGLAVAAVEAVAAVDSQRRFVFRDGELTLQPAAPDARRQLLVADSWLVAEGRVRAIDLHRDRFVGSSLASGFGDRAALDAFWASAMAAIPPVHRWFPRAELWTGGDASRATRRPGDGAESSGRGAGESFELSILMRLAPASSSTAVLGTHLGEDPRSIPSVKGPDLERLTALRDAARPGGVDDLVLLAADGSVVDGTTTALLWWRSDQLHAPSEELTRVDSVTARSVRVVARALGVTVVDERVPPSGLRDSEVWAVNALHGIRLVTEWMNGPPVASNASAVQRAALWQRRLDQLARPLAP